MGIKSNSVVESPRERILLAAVQIANRKGFDQLTARTVTDRLEMSAPALYKHFQSFDDLREALAIRAFEGLHRVILESLAGRSGAEALQRLSASIRQFARERPGELAAINFRRKRESAELTRLRSALLDSLSRVFASLGAPDERLVHITRAYRSLVFGFLTLETQGAFGRPESVDASFEEAVDIFLRGLQGRTPNQPA